MVTSCGFESHRPHQRICLAPQSGHPPVVYAAVTLKTQIAMMTARTDHMTRMAGAAMMLVAGGLLLGGCAGVGDSFASAAFVDPAKYDQFSCKQLEAERKALTNRTAELQGLILKAQTGTGGAVIGEMVYRNDYISARASAKSVEEMWERNRCVATEAAAPTPVAPTIARAKR